MTNKLFPEKSVELEQSAESTDQVIDTKTGQFYRVVKDAKEVHTICKNLVDENKDRNERNAKIAKRYNDDQPFDQGQLNAAGQTWRANFSSGFLSTVVKRAMPMYKQTIDTAKVLTSAELEDTSPAGKEKSEVFRINITRTIRRWSGWNDLITQESLENLLYGYAAAIRTDEVDWRPFFARQDEVFFPDGCSQLAEKVPYFCYRQKFQVWELAEKLKTPQDSENAGWNLNNLVNELNNAQSENRSSGMTEDARTYEDVVRENTLGSTTNQGVKVVDTYHFFCRESTGKISHWIVDEKNGNELFVKMDRFDSTTDCLALFAIEIGNGKLHGSKGAGRLLYNRALAIERSRNIALDNYYLASLLIVKTTREGKRHMAMEVAHPFMVLGEGVEVVSQSFQVNEEAFRSLDNFSVQLAEQQIGSYTPSTALMNSSSDETAAKVNYVASVEQQIRDGVLMRWWNQQQTQIYMMQKAICSPANIIYAFDLYRALTASTAVKMTRKVFDFVKKLGSVLTRTPVIVDDKSDSYDQEAVDCLLRMFREGLTPQQVYELGQCPPQQTVEDLTSRNAAVIDALAAKYAGDPLADKLAIRRDDVASKLGYSAAERWFPAKIDEMVAVEETRQQLEEYYLLLNGEDVPVSPRDNDKMHLSVLKDKANVVMQMLSQTQAIPPDLLTQVDNVTKHAEAHVQSALSKGFTETDLADEIAFVTGIRQILAQIGMGQPGIATMPNGEPQTPQTITGPQPQPVVPDVQQSAMLPGMNMAPVEAAATKPLSQTPINLTPQV